MRDKNENFTDWVEGVLGAEQTSASNSSGYRYLKITFFIVDPPKESIFFLITFYGLYFSHQYANITNNISSCYPGLDSKNNLLIGLYSWLKIFLEAKLLEFDPSIL